MEVCLKNEVTYILFFFKYTFYIPSFFYTITLALLLFSSKEEEAIYNKTELQLGGGKNTAPITERWC